jgi:hypothetical protein
MMKRTLLAATAVAAVGLFGANPADAQDFPDYKFDIGIFGGGSWYSSMLDEDHLGSGVDPVRYKAGWVTGAQLTWWVSPRFGIRANGAYSERPITGGQESQQDADGNLVGDVNLWSASGDLMIRFAEGSFGRPYLALGAGMKNTNQGSDIPLPSPNPDNKTGVTLRPTPTVVVYHVEEWTPMGLVGLGTDLRLSDNFGLRLEVGDRFWDATLHDADEWATNPDEDIGNVTHEIYGQLGLHLLLGLEEPEVVAVAPAPPAPEPEPEPEPEPVEENIVVCVIDPSADAGLREVDAIYLPETGDTLVVQNGQRTDLSGTLPTVTLANEADWFVAGEPLEFSVNGRTYQYTTWQSAVLIEADELAYIGTSRGLPVYAAAEDVAEIQEQLAEARAASATGTLDDVLEQNAELAAAIEDVQYLYVPLRPTGCVFQTVQVIEQVRKKDS